MADEVEKNEETMNPEVEKAEEEIQATEETPEVVEETPKAKPAKKTGRISAKAKHPAEEIKEPVKKAKSNLKKKKLPKVDKVALFNQKYLKAEIPKFKAGDTIKVHYQIVEGDKTRIQAFEGVCIARKHGGVNETIKVRKISGSIGVERTFFLHSRRIEKIEVKKIGQVRRAKIYFLRGRMGKAARISEVRNDASRKKATVAKAPTAQPEQ